MASDVSEQKSKIVVYTVLIGEKEALNDPLQLISNVAETDLELDFFCLTDNPLLESNTWKFLPLSHELISKEKLSRLPKACPDRYFPNYEYSIYIDNTVVFKRLPKSNDINGSIFKAFRHPWRNNPIDEADIVVRSGLDDAAIVAKQINYYEKTTRIQEIKNLTAGTVLLRKHNDEKIKFFGNLWWEQILLFSKRDQLSLDLCANIAKCSIEYFPGDKSNNDLFYWPYIVNDRRVLGSFDEDHYKWKYRGDKEATSSPRGHFLQNLEENYTNFQKRNSIFEYSCHRVDSSLGNISAPRRNLSPIIEKFLKEEKKAKKILIIGIKSDNEASVEASELIASERAFKHYFRFEYNPEITLAEIDEVEFVQNNIYSEVSGIRDFDLIIILGLTKKCVNCAFFKFIELINDGGALIAQFISQLSVQEILNMHGALQYKGKLSIFHGQHISSETVIPNSVFYLNQI